MIRLACALCLAFWAAPAAAQRVVPDADPGADPGAGPEEGLSLIERGAMILLRSMIEDLGPELDRMGDEMGLAVEQMKPALQDLARMIGDIRNYEPPQVLPNGDIIIRRKRPEGPQLPEAGEEIDL